jgi:hypothetical protein
MIGIVKNEHFSISRLLLTYILTPKIIIDCHILLKYT